MSCAGVHAPGHAGRKLRAGGAGIPLFTKTGGHPGGRGQELREFDGETYVMEHAPDARWRSVKADVADRRNLRFNLTARNFNPLLAIWQGSARVEVERVVATGEIAR